MTGVVSQPSPENQSELLTSEHVFSLAVQDARPGFESLTPQPLTEGQSLRIGRARVYWDLLSLRWLLLLLWGLSGLLLSWLLGLSLSHGLSLELGDILLDRHVVLGSLGGNLALHGLDLLRRRLPLRGPLRRGHVGGDFLVDLDQQTKVVVFSRKRTRRKLEIRRLQLPASKLGVALMSARSSGSLAWPR